MTGTTHSHQDHPPQQLRLVDVRYDAPVATELIAELQAEYVVRYGGPDETPVEVAEFAAPRGAFFVALLDGGTDAVGCGALRRFDDDTAEIKRMYVRATHRRRGLARRLLAAIEDRAAELGYRRVVLETGLEQPEALALYRQAGYQPITNFGHHKESPAARSFEKILPGRAAAY